MYALNVFELVRMRDFGNKDDYGLRNGSELKSFGSCLNQNGR